MHLVLPDGSRAEVRRDSSGNEEVLVRASHEGYRQLPPEPEPRQGTVQWYVPYTSVHPETVKGAPPDAIWVYVGHHPRAYLAALSSWWARGESFAINEHDVVNRPDVQQALEDCPEPWCAFGYDDICHPQCMEVWRNVLGCTRFRAEIIAAVPDALSALGQWGRQDGNDDLVDVWDWHNLCDGIGNTLRAAGFTHHWHYPAVHHHHQRVQGEQVLAGRSRS